MSEKFTTTSREGSRVKSQSKSRTSIAKRQAAVKALPISSAIRFGEAQPWSCTDRMRRGEEIGRELKPPFERPLNCSTEETSLWKVRTLEARKMLRHGANRKYRGTAESRRSSDGRSLNPVQKNFTEEILQSGK